MGRWVFYPFPQSGSGREEQRQSAYLSAAERRSKYPQTPHSKEACSHA